MSVGADYFWRKGLLFVKGVFSLAFYFNGNEMFVSLKKMCLINFFNLYQLFSFFPFFFPHHIFFSFLSPGFFCPAGFTFSSNFCSSPDV